MCGIVGYIGGKDAAPLLQEGLRSLEYRGYDSAGLAVVADGSLSVVRSVGKLANLDKIMGSRALAGTVGLGHTRWATHGKPSVANAHPHTDCTQKLAVVHNGIIENYGELRKRLEGLGHLFASETDTEVVAHLIEQKLGSVPAVRSSLDKPLRFLEAIRLSLLELRGAYALGILWSELPGMIVAAKAHSPLVIGLGEGETFLASDVPAFLGHTNKVLYLEDGEMAILAAQERAVFKLSGTRVEKTPTIVPWDKAAAQKGGHPHYMIKEIYEQPQALEGTLRGRLGPLQDGVLQREAGMEAETLRDLTQIHIVACGTAYHAGITGKYLLEKYARIPTSVEIASEFRYREPILGRGTLVIAVSQSGETADTLAAVNLAQERGAKVLAISNTVGSAITRAADYNLFTRCGPEIGVASTKAFIGQLTALAVFAMHIAGTRGRMTTEEALEWSKGLASLPELVLQTLLVEPQIIAVAEAIRLSRSCLFLGRGLDYPTALEGALKLKEISYIHAEGYAAGEMKHGPIALIDPEMPVVAIATDSAIHEKVISNIEEARARGARIFALVTKGNTSLVGKAEALIELPPVPEFLAHIVNAIPLQLLAYHVARLKGCDVDQPRNLAKSVTVE